MGPNVELVLLVEDNRTDSWLLQRAFERSGTHVRMLHVANGDDAVAYLRGDGEYHNRGVFPLPGVVILDLKLPRRSGFEVLQWLRHDSTNLRRLPVVVLSSSAEPKDVNRAYDLGANSYLQKPHSSAQFQELALCFQHYWLGFNEDPSLSRAALV